MLIFYIFVILCQNQDKTNSIRHTNLNQIGLIQAQVQLTLLIWIVGVANRIESYILNCEPYD